jgi:hypothetical protein
MSDPLHFPASGGLGNQSGLRLIGEFCRPNSLVREAVTKEAPCYLTLGSRVLRDKRLIRVNSGVVSVFDRRARAAWSPSRVRLECSWYDLIA